MAQHLETGLIIAIKKVSKELLKNSGIMLRFKEEIALHSKLDHPNIVKLYGFFEEEDHVCLVL